MKHLHALTSIHPRKAQFESILQLVGLMNALLAFYTNLSQVFGLPIPQKAEPEV